MFLTVTHLSKYNQEIVEEISNSKNFSYLNPDLKKVPEFKFSSNQRNKTKKIELSKVLSWAAGICLLVSSSALITKKIIDNQKPVNDYEYFEYVPDMNDAWKENSISITQYDRDGIPVNHQIIGT